MNALPDTLARFLAGEPDADGEPEARAALAGAAPALLEALESRPGEWACGLAEILAQRGGRPLARLMALAARPGWAREVAGMLPPDLVLPGGGAARAWWLGRELGPAAVRRVRRLAREGRWARLAALSREELELAAACAPPRPANAGARPLAWPAGPRGLPVLEELARLTAAEGAEAARLAAETGRRLGRAVVLLGNASLGGPPLWAVPGPWETGTPPPDAVRPGRRARALGRSRARRLGGPALAAALWELAVAERVAGRGRRALEQLTAQAAPWLADETRAALLAGRLPLAPGAYPLTQARARAVAAMSRCHRLENRAAAAITVVSALAATGRPGLVLPWADKFAASTMKGGDHAHLGEVLACLGEVGPPPLAVLIDETTHPASASLRRVLTALARARPEPDVRALGAFAGRPEPADRSVALLEAARGASLVALRPLPGPYPPADPAARATGDDARRPLTPASRDGASWLLAGTDLAESGDPLAPTGAEDPPPWLLTESGFAPLGAWLRGRVAALAGRVPAPTPAWRRYESAAGLG